MIMTDHHKRVSVNLLARQSLIRLIVADRENAKFLVRIIKKKKKKLPLSPIIERDSYASEEEGVM